MLRYASRVVERSPRTPAVGALNPRFRVLITRTHRITMSTNKQETEARATIARSRAPQKGSVTPLPRASPIPNHWYRYSAVKHCCRSFEGHAINHV
jgi:hypothetical protein